MIHVNLWQRSSDTEGTEYRAHHEIHGNVKILLEKPSSPSDPLKIPIRISPLPTKWMIFGKTFQMLE
jgi:hypothetical protein